VKKGKEGKKAYVKLVLVKQGKLSMITGDTKI